MIEGYGITKFKMLGLSVNKRDKNDKSYGNSRVITEDRIAQIYINSS